jgi:ribulose-5-phosphate 4-epimerase/fuculose-1-phosphate aldolase
MSSATAFRPAPLVQPDSEQEMRINLAACYRLVAHFGMTDLIYTHISARVPGRHDQFLINPYGRLFDQVTASSLVKIDCDGNLVEPSAYPVNQAGFVIHSAIHLARPDVTCVLHTHTRAGVAVSCLEEGLLPLNQLSLQFYGQVGYHDYEGSALELDERERLAADLGERHSLILRNHGLLTVGRTVAEAFELMFNLDKSCQIQMDVLASGARVRQLSTSLVERYVTQYYQQFNEGRPLGARAWPALLDLLDAQDPGYRT